MKAEVLARGRIFARFDLPAHLRSIAALNAHIRRVLGVSS